MPRWNPPDTAERNRDLSLRYRRTVADSELQVWVDQDLCTGDGLCVQYAPEVFEFDVDGLAYVKGEDGELQLAKGAQVEVPPRLRLEILDAAKECPGECIHVRRADGPPEPMDEDERDALRAGIAAGAA
ncbi:MAG: ferredoxin [Hamadaea sp.]|nr:ferredoxin [Hamadaea sp.]